MKNFKDLKIWQKGFQIAINGFRIIETFPIQEKYGLALQITKPEFQFLPILLKAAADEAIKITKGSLKFLWDLPLN